MLKKVLLAASTAAAAFGSTAVLADPPHWAPAYGYRGHYEHEYREHEYREHYGHERWRYRPVYVAPQPVYVVPAPRVVYAAPPAPVVYPAPVYPAPVYGDPSISIRFNLPL